MLSQLHISTMVRKVAKLETCRSENCVENDSREKLKSEKRRGAVYLSKSESGDGLLPSDEAVDPENFPLSVEVLSRFGR